MNFTNFCAFVTLISLFCPSITSIIDNLFKIKMKKIDDYELEKRKVLNEFIDSVINCINTISLNDNSIEPDAEILKSFYKSSNKLLLYFSEIDSEKINKLNDSVRTGRMSSILKDFDNLIKELAKYVKKK